MAYGHFYELDVWKRTRLFKQRMYSVVKLFPAHERYELTSQLRRAARSIPANISEGHGRRTAKDEHHFCTTARGSLSECLNHLIDAYDSGYLSKEDLLIHKSEWDALRKVLNGYMSYLQSKVPSRLPHDSGQKVQEPITPYNIESDREQDIIFHRHIFEDNY